VKRFWFTFLSTGKRLEGHKNLDEFDKRLFEKCGTRLSAIRRKRQASGMRSPLTVRGKLPQKTGCWPVPPIFQTGFPARMAGAAQFTNSTPSPPTQSAARANPTLAIHGCESSPPAGPRPG